MIVIHNFPPMLPTRPCKFCLSLQGGSVFADFDVDRTGKAYIVRISYDGYGCCDPGFSADTGRMSKQDTEILLEAVAQDRVDTATIAGILSEYFDNHQEAMWPDALIDHELVIQK
ncbi:MAG: hypothetical protein GY847_38600 [Proteobacteria bacterium]|nr:hypothetical protein [Pseudomonadota bacterium]